MDAHDKRLDPFLDGTPLAIERLKRAWGGLHQGDRAELLVELLGSESHALRWSHHRNQLIDLALADRDPYIRYIAAKAVPAPWTKDESAPTSEFVEGRARVARVDSDADPLVRFARVEGRDPLRWELSPQEFWARPQSERLALVSGVEAQGEAIAELLRFGTSELLPKSEITIDELLDVLLQYLNWKPISARSKESERWDWNVGNSIGALWKAIPTLPDLLSHALLQSLPGRAGFFDLDQESAIADSLNDRHLETLLYRDDIALWDVRRRVFVERANADPHDGLRVAAMSSHHFRLLDSEISELVYDASEPTESAKKKVDGLKQLALYCRGATLAQMRAVCDLLENSPNEFLPVLGIDDELASGKRHLAQRSKNLPAGQLGRELIEERVYEFSHREDRISAFAYTLENDPALIDPALKDLGISAGMIVPTNTWKTYLNLKGTIPIEKWERAMSSLPPPRIDDFEISPDGAEDGKDSSNERLRAQLDLLGEAIKELRAYHHTDNLDLHNSLADAFRINSTLLFWTLIIGFALMLFGFALVLFLKH